jgi:hypothetical protein
MPSKPAHIAVLTASRLPGEKAHGVRLAHLSSAFVEIAGTCTLV